MEKYRKYYGVMTFALVALVCIIGGYRFIVPQFDELNESNKKLEKQQTLLQTKQGERARVAQKIKDLKNSILTSQKKIYAPLESDLGNDTLFFTMYNDLLEMVHVNSVKIKSIDYSHYPKSDKFVEFSKDAYFVCDVNMELISNYVNLGKLIQDIYQYPYYIKINNVDIKPYDKNKTILVTNLSLRLYAHTLPQEEVEEPGLGSKDVNLE